MADDRASCLKCGRTTYGRSWLESFRDAVGPQVWIGREDTWKGHGIDITRHFNRIDLVAAAGFKSRHAWTQDDDAAFDAAYREWREDAR